jgi:hypothetical protein
VNSEDFQKVSKSVPSSLLAHLRLLLLHVFKHSLHALKVDGEVARVTMPPGILGGSGVHCSHRLGRWLSLCR